VTAQYEYSKTDAGKAKGADSVSKPELIENANYAN
jgi:hypothetical protein